MTSGDRQEQSAQCSEAQERKVLTGRVYTHSSTTWHEQKEDFDATIARFTEKRGDDKANTAPDEIIEVIVVRRARLVTEVVRVESS